MKRRFTAERSNENEWWDDRRAKTGMDGWMEEGWRAANGKGREKEKEVETSDGPRKEADGWRSKGGGGMMGDGGERETDG